MVGFRLHHTNTNAGVSLLLLSSCCILAFILCRERERERFITSLSFASGERNLGGLSRWVGRERPSGSVHDLMFHIYYYYYYYYYDDGMRKKVLFFYI